tara:strand:+ start:280 stop:885 length:606 start_codon:yes stop_codon:yes gene_type:complete
MTPPLGAFKAAVLGAAGVGLSDIEQISVSTMSGEAQLQLSIASGYSSLIFGFSYLNASAHDSDWSFQTSTNGTYNTSTTSSLFRCAMKNDGSSTVFEYQAAYSEGNSTGQIPVAANVDDGSEQANTSIGGYMQLFNPTSSVYGKNFISRMVGGLATGGGGAVDFHTAGYVNTTSALTGIEFKFDDPTANIDAGRIYYWGVK